MTIFGDAYGNENGYRHELRPVEGLLLDGPIKITANGSGELFITDRIGTIAVFANEAVIHP